MSRIFVHIGLHKTGTTSLQQFFATNEKAFNGQGIYFPCSARERRPHQIIHSNLSWELMRHDLFDPALGTVEDLVNEIAAHPDRQNWVISGEGLSRLKTPSKLLRKLSDHRVTVVVYLRDPVSLAPSLYSEQLKSGSHYTFDEWIERHARRWLDHEAILTPWRRFAMTRLQRWFYRMGVRRPLWWSAPENQVRLVERSLGQLTGSRGSLMQDFTGLIGLNSGANDLKFGASSHSNSRISNVECIGLLFINTLLDRRGGVVGKEKLETLRGIRTAIVREFGEKSAPFTSTSRQKVRLQELARHGWKSSYQGAPSASPNGDAAGVHSSVQVIADWLAAYAAPNYALDEISFACDRVVQFAAEQEMGFAADGQPAH